VGTATGYGRGSVESHACPVCGVILVGVGWLPRAEHLVAEADASDARHVMWMNRNVTKHRTPAPELATLLEAVVGRGEEPDGRDRIRR
jgi:hypothetical protein